MKNLFGCKPGVVVLYIVLVIMWCNQSALAGFDLEVGITNESEYFFTGDGDFVGMFEPNITQSLKVSIAGYDLFNPMLLKKRRFGCIYLEWSSNSANRQEVNGKTLDLGTSVDYSRVTIGIDGSLPFCRIEPLNTSFSFVAGFEMTYIDAKGSVYDTDYGFGRLPADPEDRVGPFTTVEEIKANCPYRTIDVSDYGSGLRIGVLSQTRIGKYVLLDIAGYYSGSGPNEDEEFHTIIREEISVGLYISLAL